MSLFSFYFIILFYNKVNILFKTWYCSAFIPQWVLKYFITEVLHDYQKHKTDLSEFITGIKSWDVKT